MKRVVAIGGPTGSGETTITRMLIEKYPIFVASVSATSRKPRENEKEAQAYYFFSKDVFEKEIKNGNVVEHTYIESRDIYYGTYKPDLEKKLAQRKNIIANVDIVGAKYFKDNYGATTIFLKPESMASVSERLKKRNPSMTERELEKRLNDAEKEIREEEYYYDYVVLNPDGKLKETFKKIEDILIKEGYKLDV